MDNNRKKLFKFLPFDYGRLNCYEINFGVGGSGGFGSAVCHSDKSSLDKPHFSVCDEAAAEVLSEPPLSRVLMLFLMGADFGIF